MNQLKLFTIKITASSFAVVALLSSCMGDKTQDDYLNEKANQYYQQIQKAAGTYNGTTEKSSAIGALSIDVNPKLVPGKSLDGLAQNSASVSGTIHYTGLGTVADIKYSNGSYTPSSDGNSGTIIVSGVSVSQSYGGTMGFNGTISNGVFTGFIYIEGFEKDAASFTLCRNGTSAGPSPENLKANGEILTLESDTQVFGGIYAAHGENQQAQLAIVNTDTAEPGFADLLWSNHAVMVTLTLGKAQYDAAQATIDEGGGERGEGHFQTQCKHTDSNGSGNVITLTCDASKNAYVVTSWTCTEKAGGVSNTFTVTATKPLGAE